MQLAAAQKLAAKIVEELRPFAERIEIAGSIRRQRAVVNDIDIVVLSSNPRGLRDRVKRTGPKILADGVQNFEVELHGGTRLDLWCAAPAQRTLFGEGGTNFGSLLLCRTGSAAHNIFLVNRAKTLGLRWNPYWGVYDASGACLASETEADIFTALKLDFINPEGRER